MLCVLRVFYGGSSSDLLVCIWVVSNTKDKQKYTVKVNSFGTPEEVIAEAIRYRFNVCIFARDVSLCL